MKSASPKMSWVILGLALLILVGTWTIFRLRLTAQPLKRSEMIMGTTVEITVIPANEEAVREAFLAIRKVDKLMSLYKPDSEVSLLNEQGKNQLSPETIQVIQEAIKFAEMTEGAFDITCRPLINLWKKAKKEQKIPSPEEIEQTRKLVDYRKIILKGNLVKLPEPGMKIDLGGIAKGYAVDKAIEVLKTKGVHRALVNAGGDLYVLGTPGWGKKWTVGVQDPRNLEEILTTLEASDCGIATSGDYRRYFTIEGQRFSHIVDPRTGQTVEEVPISVTIIAPDATTADALATGVFVLGPGEGMNLIESLPGVEGLIISEVGENEQMNSSRGWERFLEVRK